MSKLNDKIATAPHTHALDQQLIAAAVAEFASLLKATGFPRLIKMEHDGKVEYGVPVPSISWSVFDGSAAEALHHIRTEGLPNSELGKNKTDFFCNEWQEMRLHC